MAKWLDGVGEEKNIAISSRIRLARNIENIRLPQYMDLEDGKKITDIVNNAVNNSDIIESKDFNFYPINSISNIDKEVFVERHLISPDLLRNPQISSFLLKNDETVTIMINEEDHIRIQALLPGLNLEKAWELCSNIDDAIEKNVDYAFDERFGYLTSCPTNVGTGLRASVMLHLPCLVLTGYINNVLQAVNQIGLTVRGLYGEGTSAIGNIFQISNQVTLGESEEEIIKKLKGIVLQIIAKERDSRNTLLNVNKIQIEDKVYRSLGLLQSARIITAKESMDLLSDVRMGIDLGIIENINMEIVNKLIMDIQPASVQKIFKEELNSNVRDIRRGEIIRERLER
ncbi:putative ATP:guanido phosphotransferase [Gottschalkia purinilytica]|uniref:Protein-arginine kinase n=1 Tax=Gottschalkia purinilytica TaxID=1503 RepID=A0A0L0W8X9_GOTPU|nr:protein arginine kinase [Gottschalkia purinilytica]KNF07984.1 putative ATP:guanido phosphotransferase [Gottschalkia purinilytica]